MKRIDYDSLRYRVYSEFRPSGVPAGRYARLADAADHAETVTYRMFVVDTLTDETVYRNWKGGAS